MPIPEPEKFSAIRTCLLRILSIYLLLYFLLISDFASNYPVLWHFDLVFKAISNSIGLALNKLFFRPDFREWRFFDSYWTYSKLVAFLVFAIVAGSVWTWADKAKRTKKLFVWVFTFSRYYLAVGILLYSMWKLFETQFYLELKNFLLPVYHIGPRELFWTFMASARSYSFFGGIVEAVSVVLLLFRKTSTLGALIAMGVLGNILIMDAAYDTPVKVIVFHLLLFNAIVLWPDVVKLFRFFMLHQTETLSSLPALITDARYKTAGVIVKAAFVAIVIIPMIIADKKDYNKLNHPYYEELVGIYEIDPAGPASNPGDIKKNPGQWKKFTIEQGNTSHVLKPNDVITEFKFGTNSAAHTIDLKSFDSTSFSRFHYQALDSVHWLFEGLSGTDSVRLVTRKIDIHHYPLLNGNGKIKWTWLSNPFD